MNRNRWLLLLVTLLVANVAYYFWKNWGLVTVNCADKPFAEVVRSIARQGHVTIQSDMDADTKVSMHVTKVTVAEALESLTTATESRWRLAYFFAGDKASIRGALSTLSAGAKLEGWRTLFYPLMGDIGSESLPVDPRLDTWAVKPPAEKNLHSYLEEAARSVSAAFMFPETWNPAVSAEPSSGQIRKAVAKLASKSGSTQEEVFLVLKNSRGPGGPGGDDEGFGGGGGGFARGGGGPPREGGGRGGNMREAMQARMQAEIDKLPPAERAAALAEAEERKAFFTSMATLTPAERQAKMEEMASRQDVQDKMEKSQSQRDARMTPQQRIQRAQKYVDRKAAAKSGTPQK